MLARQTKTDLAVVSAEDVRPAGVVVPLRSGTRGAPHPYDLFLPHMLTKKQLVVKLREECNLDVSERWVERRVQKDGLPKLKNNPDVRQAKAMFSWPEVQAWLSVYFRSSVADKDSSRGV